jgi:hypothetical protein
MARDVNASINKCEKAIAQEEKNISEAKEKIRKLRKEIKKLKVEKNNQFASDLLAAIMKDGDISDEKRKEILAMLSKSEAKNFDSQNEKTALPEEKNFNDNDLQNTLSERSDF